MRKNDDNKQNNQKVNSSQKNKYYSKEEFENSTIQEPILECFSINISNKNNENEVRGYLLTLQS